MIIACPYSNNAPWKRRQETYRALRTFGFVWSYECLDHTTYDDWLYQQWAFALDDLLIIEHDNVPTADMVRALDACPEPLCVQDYRYSDGLSVHRNVIEGRVVDRILNETRADLWGLGVARFKRTFMERYPWKIEDIGKQSKEEGLSLDSRLSHWLWKQGVTAHVHYPTSKHNHPHQTQWYGGIQSVSDPRGTNRSLARLKRDILRFERGVQSP